MDKTDHSDRDHALFAPSAMARILACPDSVNASKGFKERSSSYAEEGTECHEAAADVLMGIKTLDALDHLTDEQYDIVEEYTDYCFKLIDRLNEKFDKVDVWIEERVRSDANDDWHGTADLTVRAGRTLGVIDLKAGYTPVEAKDNPQLLSYGVLALDQHKLWDAVDKVRLTIVQPRVYDKPQIVSYSVDDLYQFKMRVTRTLADITRGTVPPRKSGAHCKYCPARGRCPALRTDAVQASKIVFDEPKAPREYSPEELEAILDEAELIAAHVEGIRQHVRRELEKGREFKNWKLVPKRAVSKWTDKDGIMEKLQGYPYDAIMNMRLKAPKAIAEVLGVKVQDLSKYFVKESSGTTTAHKSDKREAVKNDPFAD